MDIQLAKQMSDKLLINNAYQMICNQEKIEQTLSVNNTNEIHVTNLATKYHFKLTQKNNGNIGVDFKWQTTTKKEIPINNEMLPCLIKQFNNNIFDRDIEGFTEIKHNHIIYRADPNFCNQGQWNDNILDAWESNKKHHTSLHSHTNIANVQMVNTTNVLAKLKCMFQFSDSRQIYCVIQSCAFQSDKQSNLSTIWMKEYVNISNSKFNHHKFMNKTNLLIGTEPKYCIVEAETIVKHCLLIPYCIPSCFYILIKDPSLWSDLFHTIT